MLDETNDNLPKADGTLESTAHETPGNGSEETTISLTPEEIQDDTLITEELLPHQNITTAEGEDVEETQNAIGNRN